MTLARVKEKENWKNIRLIREIRADEVNRLKRETDGDIAIFGSNNLATYFLEMGLIDDQ